MKILFFLSFSILLGSCSNLNTPPPHPRTESIEVYGASLANSLLGDSPNRNVKVYLPPSYHKNKNKRYPTLYLLHGFGLTPEIWTTGSIQIQHTMDRLVAEDKVIEMIIVMPNADTLYGGSYYMNSVTNGNWQDFISHDLVKFIDTKYRTDNNPDKRGIAGHSMGGFGALSIAFEVPEIFTSVYSMNTCCFGLGGGIGITDKAWQESILIETFDDLSTASFKPRAQFAIAAAVSPNPENAPFYLDLPFKYVKGKVTNAEPGFSKWANNMPLARVDRNIENIRQLHQIHFDSGKLDFPHIIRTNQILSDKLNANQIKHTVEVYEGNHFNKIGARMSTHLLPFFSRAFGETHEHK
jgi:S-formylglutathione hydrolase